MKEENKKQNESISNEEEKKSLKENELKEANGGLGGSIQSSISFSQRKKHL